MNDKTEKRETTTTTTTESTTTEEPRKTLSEGNNEPANGTVQPSGRSEGGRSKDKILTAVNEGRTSEAGVNT